MLIIIITFFQGLNPGAAIAELKKLMIGQGSKGIPGQGGPELH